MSLADQQVRLIVESYFGVKADDSLLAKLSEVHLGGGDWLFRHGAPGDSLYFLVRGRLQVWDEQIHGEKSGPRLLGEVVPGESVGGDVERRIAAVRAPVPVPGRIFPARRRIWVYLPPPEPKGAPA